MFYLNNDIQQIHHYLNNTIHLTKMILLLNIVNETTQLTQHTLFFLQFI